MPDTENAMSDTEYVLEVYKLYRERAAHEDGLVHQRMIWFVTLQALLFTSFAILLGEATPDGQAGWHLSLNQMRKLALVFSGVGMLSALAAALCVGAAYWAVDKAFQDWKTTVEGWSDARKKIAAELPSVVGAGKLTGPHTYGKLAGALFPLLVGVAWLAVIREVYGNSIFLF